MRCTLPTVHHNVKSVCTFWDLPPHCDRVFLLLLMLLLVPLRLLLQHCLACVFFFFLILAHPRGHPMLPKGERAHQNIKITLCSSEEEKKNMKNSEDFKLICIETEFCTTFVTASKTSSRKISCFNIYHNKLCLVLHM